jgi:Putative beta-barrel porin-2, OmpL-like. bbp2
MSKKSYSLEAPSISVGWIRFILFTSLILVQSLVFAEDASNTAPREQEHSAQLNTTSVAQGTPLTEREKQLLEHISALENRLAAIESRMQFVATPSTESLSPSTSISSTPVVKGSSESATDTTAPSALSNIAQDQTLNQLAPTTAQPPAKKDPFAFADFSWLTGNSRQNEYPLTSKVFTGEFRLDAAFHNSLNHPIDDTISGSTEVFRSGEIQIANIGIGGDFHWNNVRGRLLTQFGMYSSTQPRNDASPARGQWSLDNAYRYISEANAGYHWDKWNGINVDAGIFLSYIGLFSFYQFDNWSYQPSYVSSNTPWYFNGLRVQIFPSDKLKIEPWIINGWQSYGKFNKAPGIGGQVMWRPNGSVSLVFNNYWGTDTLGNPDRKRFHTDDSIQVKYYDNPDNLFDKSAFTFTFDAGCEYGGGVSCSGGTPESPSQYFLGFMAYNRFWFHKDLFALTLGGGAITNPGRYLVLIPPINGATAFSGTPYFTASPGDPFKAWDASLTFDYMPSQFTTFRWELNHRHANVPYFAGEGGVTPPGGNTGAPGSFVPGFTPDLRKNETRYSLAVLVKL